MNQLYTLFLGLTICSSFFGQVFNVGGPVTFNTKYTFQSVRSVEVMPSFDLNRVLLDNEANAANKVGPYMFGFEHGVNYNLDNSGEWEYLDNGSKIWRIRISSPGALSMNFVFSEFKLPEGAHIHLYNVDRSMVLGAYTDENNNPNNELGTDLVKGDDITIEYFVPKSASDNGRLHLTMVVHGYKDIMGWYATRGLNDSGGCNMDAICADGDDWRDEIRSVARIVNGGGVCTGTLLNDVPQSGTPYFLTANHCSPQSMGSYVFQFHYDSPTCGSQSSSNSTAPTSGTVKSINGSTLRARNPDSDFGLVELNTTPPASYNVYYAGWNNSGNTPQSAVGIHHPSGDVKKLAFDDDQLQSASGLSSVANSEWRIEAWERNTTTEGGSSGSGLWDENHFLVGQLHGGQASCSNSINDYYGKFSMSWDGNGASSSAQRLHDWLDPQSTGATTNPGWDPNGVTADYDAEITNNLESEVLCANEYIPEIVLKNNGQITLTSCTITYDVDGGNSNVYDWSGSLATNESEVITLSPVSVVENGTHTFNSEVSNPNGNNDENTSNDIIISNFIAYPEGVHVELDLMVDCYGEEVAWEITEQGSSDVLYAGGNYPGTGSVPEADGTEVLEEMCLSTGCYKFEITDTYGDGMAGSQIQGCNVDGDYTMTDFYGNTLFSMDTVNYGVGTFHEFCVEYIPEFDFSLRIFPNPTDDYFNLVIGDSDLLLSSIYIVDVRGALILDRRTDESLREYTVDVSTLACGLYLVNLVTNEGLITEKLVVR